MKKLLIFLILSSIPASADVRFIGVTSKGDKGDSGVKGDKGDSGVISSVTFSGLPAVTPGELQVFSCSDCRGTADISGTTCVAGGSGALAFSVRSSWICIY